MAHELAFGYGKMIENDSIDTASFILDALDVYADRHCFGVRDIDTSIDGIYKNSYSWLTFQTIDDRTKNFGYGLRNLIKPREYLGICAANRPEWMIANFACVLHSIITVPMYCIFSDREIIFVINNTNI
jgi:long-chain acyl-CoA synthetase